MRRVQVAGTAVLAALVAGTVCALAAGAPAAALAVAAVLAAALAAFWFAGNRVRTWAYTEREDDLIVARGVLVRRLSVVPYGRMQFVDVTAGPVERAFRLATVKLHTAAAASRSARRRTPGPGVPLAPVIPAQSSAEPSPASREDPLSEDSSRQPGQRR